MVYISSNLPWRMYKFVCGIPLGGCWNQCARCFAFTVRSNPSNGVFNITGDFFRFESFEVELLNVLGQEVYKEEFIAIEKFVSVDLQDLERGAYTIHIKPQGGVNGDRRVVFQ
jgi:hypothetical protein